MLFARIVIEDDYILFYKLGQITLFIFKLTAIKLNKIITNKIKISVGGINTFELGTKIDNFFK